MSPHLARILMPNLAFSPHLRPNLTTLLGNLRLNISGLLDM